jgi:hypothetical protein
MMKVVAYSFNGVQPIDSNTSFTSEALAAAPGKKFIVMCEAGGTMRQTVNFPMVRSPCRPFVTGDCYTHAEHTAR